jgi:hypothetical protein
MNYTKSEESSLIVWNRKMAERENAPGSTCTMIISHVEMMLGRRRSHHGPWP